MMRTSDNQVAELISTNPRMWLSFSNTEGYHPGTLAVTLNGYMIHSGLNAARNIGMKFYQRSKTEKLKFVRLQLAH